VDYPDFAEAVGLTVLWQRCRCLCGGHKIPGIRAGLCHDHYSAHQGVEHDDMNVLVMARQNCGRCAGRGETGTPGSRQLAEASA